ncbi:MAG TPA: hypothetical protein VJH24_01790 [Candidatus Bilamarchaeaceae archaeon]|nr:hypothetical protein [Candidatus Bilamarchaeaceae archaeon]
MKKSKERKCPVCEKGFLIPVSDIISEIEGMIFVENGERCNKCGEEFIPEEEGKKTISVAKRLGIWGHPFKLHRKLSKSTGGTILRIPSDIEHDMHLQGNEHVLVSRIGKKRMMVEIEEEHE